MTKAPDEPKRNAAPGAARRRPMWLRGALVVVGAGALAAGLRVYVYESAVVVGRSMSPTLDEGDYLLACKTVCVRRPLRRGEIVTFRTPGAEHVVAIKRVIGLPGEWVQIWGTQVFVNGQTLREPYVKAKQVSAYSLVYVPRGSVYVLGDNRDNSEDSRVWGPIPLASVRALALFTYFPFSKAERMR